MKLKTNGVIQHIDLNGLYIHVLDVFEAGTPVVGC